MEACYQAGQPGLVPQGTYSNGLNSPGERQMETVPQDVVRLLGPNEQVQLYIKQKIYHPKLNVESVVLTSQRIILRHPRDLGLKKDYTDYSYTDVANAILDKGIMRSTVKCVLRFGGDALMLNDLPNDVRCRLPQHDPGNGPYATPSNAAKYSICWTGMQEVRAEKRSRHAVLRVLRFPALRPTSSHSDKSSPLLLGNVRRVPASSKILVKRI